MSNILIIPTELNSFAEIIFYELLRSNAGNKTFKYTWTMIKLGSMIIAISHKITK